MLNLIKIYEESQENLNAVREYLKKNSFSLNNNNNNNNFVDEVDSYGSSAFAIACNRDYFELADLLLDLGANINIQNSNGLTPLHIALEKTLIRWNFFLKKAPILT